MQTRNRLNEAVRPSWNRAPDPLTEGAPRTWEVKRDHDLAMPSTELQQRIDEQSPSNERLLQRARRPESKPPQRWFEQSDDPFRRDGE